MSAEVPWGFPKGRVAQTLRTILAPDLTDHEVEAIVVCLFAHLLIETTLNDLLHRWLSQDAPGPCGEEPASKAQDALWQSITKMPFAHKYSLVEPYLARDFREASATIWKVNDLRNHLFHGRNIHGAEFGGLRLSEEKAIETIFLESQYAVMQLQKFRELIDRPHALAERWRDRLKELGEPLM